MEKTNFESYIEGINESWKVFKELSDLSQDAIAEIFCIPIGVNAKTAVFNLPPEQIIKEYNAHQEKLKREKKINVGDVVAYLKEKGLVIAVYEETGAVRVLTSTCETDIWHTPFVKKCNKHIEVLNWIKQGIEEAEVL